MLTPSPLRGLLVELTRQSLPCCTLVAMVLRAWVDDVVALTPAAAARRDPDWWSQSQIYDRSRPWSSVHAAARLVGSRVDLAPAIGLMSDTPPPLTVGRWHVIQRWRGLSVGADPGPDDDCVVIGASGHTYLAHLAVDGTVTIVQSSVDRGYRVATGTWVGTAGLDGYDVAVVTLPARYQ